MTKNLRHSFPLMMSRSENRRHKLKLWPTFVQLAIDVFGKFLWGFHIGWVNIECSTVRPVGISQLHRVFTHIQDISPEVLNLRVLHKVKLTHRHTNGKTWHNRKQSLFCFISLFKSLLLSLQKQLSHFLSARVSLNIQIELAQNHPNTAREVNLQMKQPHFILNSLNILVLLFSSFVFST